MSKETKSKSSPSNDKIKEMMDYINGLSKEEIVYFRHLMYARDELNSPIYSVNEVEGKDD